MFEDDIEQVKKKRQMYDKRRIAFSHPAFGSFEYQRTKPVVVKETTATSKKGRKFKRKTHRRRRPRRRNSSVKNY